MLCVRLLLEIGDAAEEAVVGHHRVAHDVPFDARHGGRRQVEAGIEPRLRLRDGVSGCGRFRQHTAQKFLSIACCMPTVTQNSLNSTQRARARALK